MDTIDILVTEYKDLISQNAAMKAQLELLHRIVDEDGYRMAEQIRMIFGWKKPKKDEGEED